MKPKYVLQDFKVELNLGINSSCFFRALGDEVKCIYLKLFNRMNFVGIYSSGFLRAVVIPLYSGDYSFRFF